MSLAGATDQVDAAPANLASGAPVTVEGVAVTHARIGRKRVSFCTDMAADPVQRNHRQGRYYAQQDLHALRQVFPRGGVFADFGANTGNHSLFAAIHMSAARVIPVEPNPRAWRLLVANVAVNGLVDRFDLTHLGVGVGAASATGFGMEVRDRNLGAAKMVEGAGDLTVVTGDTVLEGVTPNLIKIDVETMEMDVLAGLTETVARARPHLFVEVEEANQADFRDWAEAHDYDLAVAGRQYRTAGNFLLSPRAT